jgi:hypothetical protein
MSHPSDGSAVCVCSCWSSGHNQQLGCSLPVQYCNTTLFYFFTYKQTDTSNDGSWLGSLWRLKRYDPCDTTYYNIIRNNKDRAASIMAALRIDHDNQLLDRQERIDTTIYCTAVSGNCHQRICCDPRSRSVAFLSCSTQCVIHHNT